MNSVIETIHNKFLNEAKNSPMLMSDLANMEQYISESYSGRSLIELLQNADDAKAKRFLIANIDAEHVIVANDGRCFTEDDLYSLCRSGASTKRRQGDTIGFRGIGFKSIVNYAKQVHLVSGELSVTFSKQLTSNILPELSNIPLIRIPHFFAGERYSDEIEKIREKGYNTIFVFEIKKNGLELELKDFDATSLLFLRNINEVAFEHNEMIKYVTIKETQGDYEKVSIKNKTNDGDSSWLVYSEAEVSMAYAEKNGQIIDANGDNSVIHSFMPTKDRFCIPCKINGDFSTDPSRTKIVYDDETIKTTKKCADMFANKICRVLDEEKDDKGLVNIVSQIKFDPLSKMKNPTVNSLFFDELKKGLHQRLSSHNITIKPEWISEESFLEIQKAKDNYLISQTLEMKIHGLTQLLKTMGFLEYSLNMALEDASNNVLTERTRLDILKNVISQTRYSMPNQLRDTIVEAYLFPINGKIIRLKDLGKTYIDKEFLIKFKEILVNEDDLYWFAKKIGIEDNIGQYEPKGENNQSTTLHTSAAVMCGSNQEIHDELKNHDSTENHPSEMSFGKEEGVIESGKSINIKKWRSVEENVIEYLKTMPDVARVKDVSLMNVGYDAEVIKNDGEMVCVEIKSVNSFSEAFVMTNNEYALASQNGEHYALAIACAKEMNMQVCMIYNPAKALELSRRIVRWEWVCNSYQGEMHEVPYGQK